MLVCVSGPIIVTIDATWVEQRLSRLFWRREESLLLVSFSPSVVKLGDDKEMDCYEDFD